MTQLIRLTNAPSDNFMAETLAKEIALTSGTAAGGAAAQGTTAGGMARVGREMAALGLHPTLVDGSGLSRANRTSAADVTSLLISMHGTRAAQQFEDSLAIAGLSGTLRRRLRGTFAAGALPRQDRARSTASARSPGCASRARAARSCSR